jgi:hypothetical protein
MARPRKRRNRNHRQEPYPGANHDTQQTPEAPVAVQEAPGETTSPASGMNCPLCAGRHELQNCNLPILWNRLPREKNNVILQTVKLWQTENTDEKKKEIHKRHREKNRMARKESTRLSQATAKAKKQGEDAESKGEKPGELKVLVEHILESGAPILRLNLSCKYSK